MRVAIAGGTGMIGASLATALRERGDEVLVLTRGTPKEPGQLQWDPDRRQVHRGMLGDVDALVNLAGAPVGRRWSDAYKEKLRTSRLRSTDFAARLVAEQPSAVLINGSAVGYYGSDRADEPLSEASRAGTTFLAGLTQDWEAATAPAQDAGNRVALARTGIVLAPRAMSTMPLLALGFLGLSGPLGSGQQNWAWITLVDEVRALVHLIDTPVRGPVNLVGPTPATQMELTTAIARAHRGRALAVPLPAPVLRLALGEFAEEVLGSQRVEPTVLQQTGFTFKHPTVDDAAAWLVGRSA